MRKYLTMFRIAGCATLHRAVQAPGQLADLAVGRALEAKGLASQLPTMQAV